MYNSDSEIQRRFVLVQSSGQANVWKQLSICWVLILKLLCKENVVVLP